MYNILFDLNNIRVEISFKTFDELRSILSFYKKNNINKINIPCKSNLKKDFLLSSIKISRDEFPEIDIIPHFSIQHEFKKNSFNTMNSFIKFLEAVKNIGCTEALVVSGSQKRSSLDSLSAISLVKDKSLFINSNFSIGVAFNPYLSELLFEEEIMRLEKKLKSFIVNSIWIQFGTDFTLLERRIKILNSIISSTKKNSKSLEINLYGSVLIPSKQFLARFKYRPWKGVYCSNEFLGSVSYANKLLIKILQIYKKYKIFPIIETNTSSEKKLKSLESFINF